MSHFHAVVWLDHAEAKIFPFNAEDFEKRQVLPAEPHRHLHHKAGAVGSGHAQVDKHFFESVAAALSDSVEILVVGPGSAKTEFAAYAKEKAPALAKRIVAVQSADHPSDRQIVAHARTFFKAADRMLPRGA
jgi:stalled ribosome rescue protein Dom34